jgi:hypothetical protein
LIIERTVAHLPSIIKRSAAIERGRLAHVVDEADDFSPPTLLAIIMSN